MDCHALPSEIAAINVFKGEKDAISEAVHYSSWRALAIAIQLYALGVREDLIKYSLAASLGVELNVLIWAYNVVKDHPDIKFLGNSPSTCLPFGPEKAAAKLARGEWTDFFPIVYHTFVRSLWIAGGLYAAGEREKIVKYSLVTSVGVQVGILAWAWKQIAK